MNRLIVLTITCVAMLCATACTKAKPTVPVKEYKIVGEILKVNPVEQSATIKHEAIEGWMGAMTMDYPIKSKEDMAKLHVGDHIEGTVYVQDEEYSVGNIHTTK